MREFLYKCLIEREKWLCQEGPIFKLAKESFSLACVRVWRICWFEIPGNAQDKEEIKSDEPSIYEFSLNALRNVDSYSVTMLACSILQQTLVDIRKPVETLSISKQRKIQANFKQHHLIPLFIACSDILRNMMQNQSLNDPVMFSLAKDILDLIISIQNFMYHSTYPDESNDDIDIINVNNSWTSILQNITVFFDFYKFNLELSPKTLEVIVNLLGMRSVGMDTEASKLSYLEIIVDNIGSILQFKTGLDQSINRHNLCRLFHRMEANYRVDRFLEVKNFKNLIDLYIDYCYNLLNIPDTGLAIIFYFFKFWSQVINRLSSKPAYDQEMPRIQDIILSFLKYVTTKEINCDVTDTLLEDEQWNHIIKLIPKIVQGPDRKYICDCVMDEAARTLDLFNNAISLNNLGEIECIERQLAWFVHVMDTLMHDRITNEDSDEYVDADLNVSVFAILRSHNQRLLASGKTPSTKFLEMALITFLKGFVLNFYASEEEQILAALNEAHQLSSSEMILEVLLEKIINNMKIWSEENNVVMGTLDVLSNLTNTRLSSSLMSKSALTHNLIAHHNDIELGVSRKYRTSFYKTVSKSILSDVEGEMFDMFIDSFDKKLLYIASELESNNYSVLKGMDLLMSDLKGVIISCLSHQTYIVFFDWFFGRNFFFTIIPLSLKYFLQNDISSVFSVLKFLSSFVDNINRRISFDNSSYDGNILFKQTAEILITVGEAIFTIPATGPANGKYNHSDIVNKLVQHFFSIFSKIIGGDYCYYGAIYYYNDDILVRLLGTCFRIMSSLSLPDVQEYKKTFKSLFDAIEKICLFDFSGIFMYESAHQVSSPAEVTSLLLSIIRYGLNVRENRSIVNNSSYALEMLAKHNFDEKRTNSIKIYDHTQHASIINDILLDMFEVLVSDEGEANFALSKALFCCIIFEPESFKQLKDVVIKSQAQISMDKGLKMENAFEELTGFTFVFSRDNIDIFCQNAMAFRNITKNFIDQVSFYRHIGR